MGLQIKRCCRLKQLNGWPKYCNKAERAFGPKYPIAKEDERRCNRDFRERPKLLCCRTTPFGRCCLSYPTAMKTARVAAADPGLVIYGVPYRRSLPVVALLTDVNTKL